MTLNDFIEKPVQGLYAFVHFEAPNGAWVQRSVSLPTYWVFCDPAGNMTDHYTFAALVAAVEGYDK